MVQAWVTRVPRRFHVPDRGVPIPAVRSCLPRYRRQSSAVSHLGQTTWVPTVASSPSLFVKWLSLLCLYRAGITLRLAVEGDQGDRQADAGQVD